MMESKPCWIDFYERGEFTECDCNCEKDCFDCERYGTKSRDHFDKLLSEGKVGFLFGKWKNGQRINRESHRECKGKDI